MTVGLSATQAAALLNIYRDTAADGIDVFVKLHTGDPGVDGTANASAVTTRNQLVLAAPSGGSSTMTSLSNYSMTATETISHASLWDHATAGTFRESMALTAPVPVINGSTLSFSAFTKAFTPIAA